MADENEAQAPARGAGDCEMKEPIVVVPNCPYCGNQLVGFNVCQMALPTPTPQGMMTFLVPVCPHPECGAALAFQFIGYQKPEPGSGLWTPPGRA